MRKYAQKQRAQKTEEAPEVQATDVKDEELAKETDELLAKIECCLTEAVVTDEEKDLKAQAKAEWEANEHARRVDRSITADEYWYNREEWLQKYQAVIKMEYDCCGQVNPVWDES